LGFVVQGAHHIGSTRRIIRKYYPDEFGSFDQERQVLKGILKLLLGISKELVTKPVLAWKKLSLVFVVLISAAVGYLVPVPSYSPIEERS
jgi:hypothetical protein